MAMMERMLEAAILAAAAIREIYESDFEATIKADGSPVTEADARAEEIIVEALAPLKLPILAEESVAAGRIPELGERYFVVDPLDGTKEFLKRNGEFAVNIALCEEGRPIAGVVLAPATGRCYWGSTEHGALSGVVLGDGTMSETASVRTSPGAPIHIVASRSHAHPAIRLLCKKMHIAADITVGSSLKFGLLATGAAQIYPRFGPTSEWDTAAGQAVVEAAGGVVWDLEGHPLTCGHPDRKFLNGPFVAAASPELAAFALDEIANMNR